MKNIILAIFSASHGYALLYMENRKVFVLGPRSERLIPFSPRFGFELGDAIWSLCIEGKDICLDEIRQLLQIEVTAGETASLLGIICDIEMPSKIRRDAIKEAEKAFNEDPYLPHLFQQYNHEDICDDYLQRAITQAKRNHCPLIVNFFTEILSRR